MTNRVPPSTSYQPVHGTSPAEKPAEQTKPLKFGGYSALLSVKTILSVLADKLENACQAVLKAAASMSRERSMTDNQLANEILGRLNSQSVPLPNGTAKGLGDLVQGQFEQDKRPVTYDEQFRNDVKKNCLPIAAQALKDKFYEDHELEFLSFIENRGFEIDPENKGHEVMRAFVRFCVLAAAENEHSNIENALESAALVLKRFEDAVKDNGPGGIDKALRDGALASIMKEKPRDILDLMSHDDGSRFIVETAIKDIKQNHPSRYGYVVHPTWKKY